MIRILSAPVFVNIETGRVDIELDAVGTGYTIDQVISNLQDCIEELREIQIKIDMKKEIL